MTNFDFLKNTPDFDAFADVAISAEKLLHIDVDSCLPNYPGLQRLVTTLTSL